MPLYSSFLGKGTREITFVSILPSWVRVLERVLLFLFFFLFFPLGKGTRENTFENAADAYSANCMHPVEEWGRTHSRVFFPFFGVFFLQCKGYLR